MHASVRAFAEGLIDYAGLFPPAALPLEEAFRLYAGYRRHADAWMLGRFICPAARLSELAGLAFDGPQPSADGASGPGPLRIAALGRGGTDAGTWLADLGRDLEAIARFHAVARGQARVEALELRGAGAVAPDLLAAAAGLLAAAPAGLEVFYEIPPSGDWRSAWTTSLAALGASRRPGTAPGFKLRCGGITAEAFPTVEQVAFALDGCRGADVPFKATAGLHHPVRAHRAEVGTKMHGFLNVFGAALLSREHALDAEAIRPILEEEDPGAFSFGPDGFAWRGRRIGIDRIRSRRRDAAISFGSCSFDEPRDDLRALGLLDA